MEQEFRALARKQYLKYFAFWFVLVAIFAALTIFSVIKKSSGEEEVSTGRGNLSAPVERVFDYADVLSDSEEHKLRKLIAEKEEMYKADFVILTFSQPVEGASAKEEYGYDSTSWDHNMRDLADAFWDDNGFGYNKSFEGDGSILIDNRSPEYGDGGEYISTSGKVERAMGGRELERTLYAIDDDYSNPYKAYVTYINEVCRCISGEKFVFGPLYYVIGLGVVLVIALVYFGIHRVDRDDKDTNAITQYVPNGQIDYRVKTDTYDRKSVVKRRIETSSGGGGGGHHTSHGGASHGGGGHRH